MLHVLPCSRYHHVGSISSAAPSPLLHALLSSKSSKYSRSDCNDDIKIETNGQCVLREGVICKEVSFHPWATASRSDFKDGRRGVFGQVDQAAERERVRLEGVTEETTVSEDTGNVEDMYRCAGPLRTFSSAGAQMPGHRTTECGNQRQATVTTHPR